MSEPSSADWKIQGFLERFGGIPAGNPRWARPAAADSNGAIDIPSFRQYGGVLLLIPPTGRQVPIPGGIAYEDTIGLVVDSDAPGKSVRVQS